MSVGNKGVVANLGYPRIGEHCQWKEVLEQFWAGHISQSELHRTMRALRLQHINKQAAAGVGIIPVGDFSLYDHVLDHSIAFGLIPERYSSLRGADSLHLYYAMAKGTEHSAACETASWFDTNYHYVVPEWVKGFTPQLCRNHWLEHIQEAPAPLRAALRPVMIGPYSFTKLIKGLPGGQFESVLRSFIPVYAELLDQLSTSGIEWVQIDEPALSQNMNRVDYELLQDIYGALGSSTRGIKLMLQTYFGAASEPARLFQLPVDGIGLDFVHDQGVHGKAIAELGFPQDKVLGVGIVDGSNIWRTDLSVAWAVLDGLIRTVPAERLLLQPSCSLLHVPVTLRNESKLPHLVRLSLAFADEKLAELAVLSRGLREGRRSIALDMSDNALTLQALAESPSRNRIASGLEDASQHIGIGSIPSRLFEEQQHAQEMTGQYFGRLARAADGQEALDSGSLLEWLGRQLDGYLFTANGWTQRTGASCVKQPIIYGDIVRIAPTDTLETNTPPALTSTLFKGMLTGPLTMLRGAFTRTDIPQHETAIQLAIAIHSIVKQFDSYGSMRADEPKPRGVTSIKLGNWDTYLHWGAEAFLQDSSDKRDSKLSHKKLQQHGFAAEVRVI
ncbi:hypothetical protein [Paenibacillus mendelii]|uniref:5-methyltetrahydropteroyltriglutamate--homocysteine S-methyltransferase n=1 Tax=Paenibacillus mendelii TaxID=206163 RepID=A0ABV6J8Q3_9BACL|nr:hypothetical protein [Paenibacillus mendelii]MCQ6559609.1 hypothetical protein [Paenibacillus mendelii]